MPSATGSTHGGQTTSVNGPTGILRDFAIRGYALAKVLNGEDDVATVAETPVMWSVLKGAHPTIFAAIEASDRDVSVVARTDAGVRMPADLAGKRIGMVPGTNHEYFLDLFLGVNKIAPASVTIVPVTMADGADALASGRIDALSSWVTARARLRAAIPDQIVIFPNDGIYLELWTLTARPEFLKARPETARRLLRALIAAERYTAAHRADAIAIVAPHIGLDTAAVERIWDDFGFNVSLDQSVVANLEGEARHEIKNRPGAAGPDFFKNISADALTAVDPGRVTIILP